MSRRGSKKSKKREIKRFFDFTAPAPKCTCILFTGHRDNKGYGRFRSEEFADELGLSVSRMVKAHRYAYFLIRGRVPDERGLVYHPELEIDHACAQRGCDHNETGCVNPYHHQLLTKSENTAKGNVDRGIARSRPVGQYSLDDLEIELPDELPADEL